MRELLLRTIKGSPSATFGDLLREDGTRICVTLERPWLDNRRRESCIPAGRYRCVWKRSPKFGWTFEVTGVPDRDAILFHAGNKVRDSLGCILTGRRFAADPIEEIAGGTSQPGLRDFFAEVGTADFWLTVDRAALHAA